MNFENWFMIFQNWFMIFEKIFMIFEKLLINFNFCSKLNSLLDFKFYSIKTDLKIYSLNIFLFKSVKF
jgi:hypothetical protein